MFANEEVEEFLKSLYNIVCNFQKVNQLTPLSKLKNYMVVQDHYQNVCLPSTNSNDGDNNKFIISVETLKKILHMDQLIS